MEHGTSWHVGSLLIFRAFVMEQRHTGQDKQTTQSDHQQGETWLTHFIPLALFYTPCKYHKNRGFPMLSGVIEKDH